MTIGLGSYTIECLLIYIKSMNRGTNHWKQMSKGNYLFSSRDLPCKVKGQKYKLNVLHYIMNQHEKTLLFTFFKVQMESPTKGDWVSEVKAWICEYEIATSLKEV